MYILKRYINNIHVLTLVYSSKDEAIKEAESYCDNFQAYDSMNVCTHKLIIVF